MRNSGRAPTPARFAPVPTPNRVGTCRVPGCGGPLRFVADQFGRLLDICLSCERRIEYVRALETMLGITGENPVHAAPFGARKRRVRSATPLKILALLKRSARAVGVQRIATTLGVPRGRVDVACSELVRDGLVRRERMGCYALAKPLPFSRSA